MANRIRALVIAELCSPEWVSVPLVGWSHFRALADVADVHLVTQVRSRDSITRAGLVEGRDVTFIDSEKIAAPIEKFYAKIAGGDGKAWTTRMALQLFGWKYFQKVLWKQLGERIANREWDVVHQITPLSPTMPSSIAGKCKSAGVAFIWGPINGGLPWPKGFGKELAAEKEWLSKIRGVYKLLPGYQATRRNAKAIVVGSINTLNQIPDRYHDKCFYLPENAIDPARFVARRAPRSEFNAPLRCVFLGRLVPYKGATILLDASEQLLKDRKITIDFIGDGPQRSEIEKSIRDRNIPGVTLVGWVDHKQVQHKLAQYDLLTFPSIREFGGAVALEAMAVGVPSIVCDYGGLGELVTDKTGWKIPMGSRQSIVERLSHTLSHIVQHPELIEEKSRAALVRAHVPFTWNAKAKQVLEVWNWAVGKAPKPTFAMPIPD